MRRFRALKPGWALGAFTALDVLCIGMGMGVPIFCILLGFPLGWYIVRNVTLTSSGFGEVFKRVLLYAAVAAGVTFIGMLVIWGPTAGMLCDPGADLANFGIPMILYEPRASFIGWLVLMIAVSPFLQLLMTLFGSHVTLLSWLERERAGGEQGASVGDARGLRRAS